MMGKTLTSPKEYNRQARLDVNTRALGHSNGIACPECNSECSQFNFDTEAVNTYKPGILGFFGVIDDNEPVRKKIHCNACGWKGTKIV